MHIVELVGLVVVTIALACWLVGERHTLASVQLARGVLPVPVDEVEGDA
ncbi:hypothetical protein [Cognatilysobacter lacus]|nr:hypothetical protein [Lysobacter lacus]